MRPLGGTGGNQGPRKGEGRLEERVQLLVRNQELWERRRDVVGKRA